jgi:hypothetical protein
MPYYYGTASQQNTNGSANTDTLLLNLKTTASGQRAALQKVMAGSYASPADNAIRLRVHRVSVANLSSGSAVVPNPMIADAPASNVTSTTLPTIGSGVLNAVPPVQLAFNQRGTAMWAAFNPDEGVGIVGPSPNGNNEIVLDSQSTGTTVAVNFEFIHSE